MCSLKMLVVMSIMQLYQSLVILYYCWSNIRTPKFKVFELQKTAAKTGSLNIITSSAVHQPTADAKTGGSTPAESGRNTTARIAL